MFGPRPRDPRRAGGSDRTKSLSPPPGSDGDADGDARGGGARSCRAGGWYWQSTFSWRGRRNYREAGAGHARVRGGASKPLVRRTGTTGGPALSPERVAHDV